MTEYEFIEAYAYRSEVSVSDLAEWGQVAIPCVCDYLECEGWQMVSKATHEHRRAMLARAK